MNDSSTAAFAYDEPTTAQKSELTPNSNSTKLETVTVCFGLSGFLLGF